MPSLQWIKQNQREQTGKLNKSMINGTSDKHLGYWYEDHQIAR